jgi:hypothetical protein
LRERFDIITAEARCMLNRLTNAKIATETAIARLPDTKLGEPTDVTVTVDMVLTDGQQMDTEERHQDGYGYPSRHLVAHPQLRPSVWPLLEHMQVGVDHLFH